MIRQIAAAWTAFGVLCCVLVVSALHLAAGVAAYASWVGEVRPHGDSESERAALVAFLALVLEAFAAAGTAVLVRLPARRRAWARWAYLPVAVVASAAGVGISWGPLYLITP